MASRHLGFLLGVSSPETFCCHSLHRIIAQAQAYGLLSFFGFGHHQCRRPRVFQALGRKEFLSVSGSSWLQSSEGGRSLRGRVNVFSKSGPRRNRERYHGRRERRLPWI